jgi:hypothetical protein
MPRILFRRVSPTLMLLALLLLGLTPAVWAIPPQPCTFFGTVSVNGADVPAGSTVTAVVYAADGVTEVTHSTSAIQFYNGHSVYSVTVAGDDDETPLKDGAHDGDIVRFVVRVEGFSVRAEQQGVWQTTGLREVNLTAEREEHRIYLPFIARRG